MADEPKQDSSINSGHVLATTGVTAALANVLVWATTLPLKALDAPTSLAMATILVGCFAATKAYLDSRAPSADRPTPVDKPAPTATGRPLLQP